MATNGAEGDDLKIGDFAVLLSIGSVLLYALGWTYWAAFFSYFDLSVQVIGPDFYSVISTTWFFVLLLALLGLQFLVTSPSANMGRMSLLLVTISPLFLLYYAVLPLTLTLPTHISAIVLAGLLGINVLLVKILGQRTIVVPFLVRERSTLARLLSLLVPLALSFTFYAVSGLSNAMAAIRNDRCVSMTLGDSGLVHLNASLVARTGSLWIIVDRAEWPLTRQAHLLNESAITEATSHPCRVVARGRRETQ